MTIKEDLTRTQKLLKKLAPRSFSELLKAVREADEITITGLAKKAGVSKQDISDIEHEKKPVGLKKAKVLAKAWGYSEDVFVKYALEGMLKREGLSYHVTLEKRNKAS